MILITITRKEGVVKGRETKHPKKSKKKKNTKNTT
jgi:hypothetical protein